MSSKSPTFASAYQELESLTQEFEKGDLDLELAIPKFKRAAELAKFLKKRLSELENQIKEIDLDLEKDISPVTAPIPDNSSNDIDF